MFLGDKGSKPRYRNVRYNFDVLVDNEKMTLSKLSQNLGFFDIVFERKLKEIETYYDNAGNLLTNTGLIIRKKTTPKRSYFTLIRMSDVRNFVDRERKEFLGECNTQDQPSDFPVQIADKINEVFNNLFTINLVDLIKHTSPYIVCDVTGNRYRIVSGTGYEAELCFEWLNIKNVRTGKKAKIRNVSVAFTMDPDFEKERQHILWTIDRYCKELVPLNHNHFEIANIEVKTRIPNPSEQNEEDRGKKKGKKKKEEGE